MVEDWKKRSKPSQGDALKSPRKPALSRSKTGHVAIFAKKQ